MKKIIIALCVAVVLFAIGYNAYQSEKQATGYKKNVYALVPLSGPVAWYGKDIQREIQLMEKEKNYSFHTIFLDSAAEGQKAVLALQQATLNEKKPIVITTFSAVSSAIAPTIAQRNGFMFALSTFLVKTDTQSYIKLMGDEQTVMKPVVKYIQDKKLQKIAVFYIESDYGLKEFKYVRDYLKEKNIDIVTTVTSSRDARDVRLEALKLIDSDAQAILVLGDTVPAYINLIQELKLQGYTGQLIADGGLRVPMVLQLLKEKAENIVFPALTAEVSMPHAPNIEKNIDILKKYNLPVYYVLLETADALDLIQYTLDKKLPFTRQTYENMHSWSGMMGNITFKEDKATGHDYILAQVKDGKIVPVESEEK